jgi:hypothetical protein
MMLPRWPLKARAKTHSKYLFSKDVTGPDFLVATP